MLTKGEFIMGIVCICNNIDRDELIKVIKSGANTLESLKKATGACTGHCNGKRCEKEVIKLLKQYS